MSQLCVFLSLAQAKKLKGLSREYGNGIEIILSDEKLAVFFSTVRRLGWGSLEWLMNPFFV